MNLKTIGGKMTLLELLKNKPDVILLDATDSLVKSQLEHYKQLSPERLRYRMANLFEATVLCTEEGKNDKIIQFIEKIGEERFESGYKLHEVQAAINMLEECLWKKIVDYVKVDQQKDALVRVNNILNKAKEVLVSAYVAFEKEHSVI
jgi:hypothetical protein